jgi:23S rRNA pseudouridine1911/1915/1917 synthase
MRVVPAHAANNKRQKRGASTTPAKTGSPGKRALSFVDTLATNGKLSLVRVKIETGRTHQIRVHLQDKRTPVYGDDLYGFPDWNKRLDKALPGGARPLLHAYKLQLHHPVTGERLAFTAPIPDDMAQILKTISPNAEEDFPEIVGPTFSHGDTPW